MLERMGHPTGIDLDGAAAHGGIPRRQLGHEVPALLPRAGTFP